MRGSGFPTPPAAAGRPARWLALAAALAAFVAVESLTRAETPADPVRPEANKVDAKADGAKAEAAALDHKVMDAIKADSEIMANLTYLSDVIGPRLTGSANVKAFGPGITGMVVPSATDGGITMSPET